MGIQTSFVQKEAMKVLILAAFVFLYAELGVAKKYLVQTEAKGAYGADDDYRLKVGGDVIKSKFDTASDHDVEVKGNVLRSNVHNYRGAGKGKNGGLKVRGNVKWSDVDTASEHDASVDGNVYQSKFHNYRGKSSKKSYGGYKKRYGDYADDTIPSTTTSKLNLDSLYR